MLMEAKFKSTLPPVVTAERKQREGRKEREEEEWERGEGDKKRGRHKE